MRFATTLLVGLLLGACDAPVRGSHENEFMPRAKEAAERFTGVLKYTHIANDCHHFGSGLWRCVLRVQEFDQPMSVECNHTADGRVAADWICWLR